MAAPEALTSLVKAFGASTVNVAKSFGLGLKIDKDRISSGVNAPNSCSAALIGVIGGGVHGTVVIMTDRESFSSMVTTMSGGMIQNPDVNDPMAMSALGELANMICGGAIREFPKVGLEGAEITPPQLFVGDNLRSVPSESPGLKHFTVPFVGPRGERMHLILSFK